RRGKQQTGGQRGEKTSREITHRQKIALSGPRTRACWSLALPIRHPSWHKPRGGEVMPDFNIERRCTGLVCGIDEAGRGPLAGPVVAAAVILEPRRFPKGLRERLDDSKVLSPDERETCYRALRRCVDRGVAHIGVGAASVPEIDRINILRAALLA